MSFYSDNATEPLKAAANMGWPPPTAAPGKLQSNGVAERSVKTVVEGVRTVMEHAGMGHKCWHGDAACCIRAQHHHD